MAHQPQQLVATAISTTEITLSWTDVDTLEDETYDIERDSVVVEEGWAGGTTYTDTGLDPDTEYTYRVRAAGGTEAGPNPNADVTLSTVVTASVVLTPTVETVTPFAPTDIAGLVGWYDFSVAASNLWQDTARTIPTTTDGQGIGGVTDKSGSGNHLLAVGTVPTYKTGIINSRSVARFTTGNLGAGIAADVSWTGFIVVQKRSAPAGTSANLFYKGLSAQMYTNSGSHATGWNWYASQAGAEVFNIGGPAVNVNTVVLQVVSAASMKFYVNGGTPTSIDPHDSVTSTANMYLGAASGGATPADIDLAEVIVYDSSLSAADANLVGDYLADRWGLTWTAVS